MSSTQYWDVFILIFGRFCLVLNLMRDDLGSFLDRLDGPARPQKLPAWCREGGPSPPPPNIGMFSTYYYDGFRQAGCSLLLLNVFSIMLGYVQLSIGMFLASVVDVSASAVDVSD